MFKLAGAEIKRQMVQILRSGSTSDAIPPQDPI